MFEGMAEPAEDRRRALYEAYQKVPPHQHAEIVRGTLYVLPRPAPRHANASSVLGGELSGPFQRGRGGPGGWWILDEPELQLIELEPVVPDLAGWRVERMPALPETAYFSIAPDWICEVLSKSTEPIDRDEKLPLYAEQGVEHVWLIDPIAKTLEVHAHPESGRWREVRVHQGDVRVRVAPFEAIELELAALWSPPRVG
jgi:Uma2 family endonuclease